MRIRITVRTDRVGSKVEHEFEIPDEELADYPEGKEREMYIEECCKDEIYNQRLYEWDWHEST